MTVYESIGQLRDQGIKMKDIADRLDMPPSVLSAIYSTVLPAYLDNLSRQEEDAALENALSLVNNVSKKRLLSSLPDMLRQLQNYCSPVSEITLPIEKSLAEGVRLTVAEIGNYTGVYQSYSLSSSSDEMVRIIKVTTLSNWANIQEE